MIPTDARRLSLFVNGSTRCRGRPLYRAIVEEARERGLAGASVFLVDLSYGARGRLHDVKSEYTFVDVPVTIEVIDAPERLDDLAAGLAELIPDGFATVEPVRVVFYGHHPEESVVEDEIALEAPVTEGVMHMPIEGDAKRLTVYVGSSDTWQGRNLAQAIVGLCRKRGLAGATASLGVMGFGKSSRIHRAHFLGLSEDLPERVEIVDRAEAIEQLLPAIEAMVDGGLILLEDVRAIHYGHHP